MENQLALDLLLNTRHEIQRCLSNKALRAYAERVLSDKHASKVEVCFRFALQGSELALWPLSDELLAVLDVMHREEFSNAPEPLFASLLLIEAHFRQPSELTVSRFPVACWKATAGLLLWDASLVDSFALALRLNSDTIESSLRPVATMCQFLIACFVAARAAGEISAGFSHSDLLAAMRGPQLRRLGVTLPAALAVDLERCGPELQILADIAAGKSPDGRSGPCSPDPLGPRLLEGFRSWNGDS